MIKSEQGFIEEFGILLVLGFFLCLFLAMFCVRFQASQSVVSGIVYNTETNSAISGKTTFAIRASVDTYISQDNESYFCLPAHSPYESLIEKAAANKNIKVIVTAGKYFAIQSPFTCQSNVTVKEEK